MEKLKLYFSWAEMAPVAVLPSGAVIKLTFDYLNDEDAREVKEWEWLDEE